LNFVCFLLSICLPEWEAYGYTLILNAGSVCSSACGLIFISGVKREVPNSWIDSNQTLGFHQPYKKDKKGNKICEEVDSTISDQFLLYAMSKLSSNAAEIFHKNVIGTACTKTTYFSAEELVKSGIATGFR
jgi:hypothetical protein